MSGKIYLLAVTALFALSGPAWAGCLHQTWNKKNGGLLSGSYSTQDCQALKRNIASVANSLRPAELHTFTVIEEPAVESLGRMAIQD